MATTTTSGRLAAFLLVAVLAPAAVVVACSSNNSNPQPTTPVYTVGNDTGVSTNPSNDSGQGTGDASADAAPTQLDGAPVLDGASCTTDAGCWSCTPATPPEFLNQCTASQCSPFVNATRLPNYDGGLPPLN